MRLKSLAIVFCGLLALSTAACREHTYELFNKDEEEQAPWLRNVLAAEVTLPPTGTETEKKLSELLQRAAAMPGVERAAVVNVLPGDQAQWHQIQIEIEGSPSHMRPAGFHQAVSPEYFATMERRLLRGRYFSAADDASGPLVAIVNESFARYMWHPGDHDNIHDDLIGKRVKIGGHAGPWMTIVGIVQDGPRAQHSAELYVPYTQHAVFGPDAWSREGVPSWYLLVRTGNPEEMAVPLQREMRMEFRALSERLADSVAARER